jgi:hypothetical protein
MIPKRLDILGKQWSVSVEKIDDGDYGVCKHSATKITVHPEQTPDCMRDTLLHEVMHAIDIEMQTRMGERRVRLMATGLLQVLRHNKQFAAFLTEA